MEVIDEFLTEIKKYKIISIIGLAKNVSKTTTLNHIIRNSENVIKLGLTSIGRDGEPYDVITKLPKPRIYIKKGTYIATAEQSYRESNIQLELIKATGFTTPLGEIMILKAKDDGYVELAGPSINSQISIICQELQNIGCDLVLIDGAFDRRSFATPIISDATILSTGASVSEDINFIVNLTTHTIDVLTIEKEIDEKIINKANEILSSSKIGLINSKNSIKILNLFTALDSSKEVINNLESDTKYIVIKGAVTDNLLKDLTKQLKKHKDLTILAEDATKLFLSPRILAMFKKKGGIIKVLIPIKIIALTLNPASPLGYEFEEGEFLKLLKEKIDLPIYNLGPCE